MPSARCACRTPAAHCAQRARACAMARASCVVGHAVGVCVGQYTEQYGCARASDHARQRQDPGGTPALPRSALQRPPIGPSRSRADVRRTHRILRDFAPTRTDSLTHHSGSHGGWVCLGLGSPPPARICTRTRLLARTGSAAGTGLAPVHRGLGSPQSSGDWAHPSPAGTGLTPVQRGLSSPLPCLRRGRGDVCRMLAATCSED